jgi:ATP-binding cassette subfamily B protein
MGFTQVKKSGKKPGAKKKAGLFSVLGPYKGIVTLLIIIALAGSGVNLLIPKIIARAIDSLSASEFRAGTVITEFLLAGFGIFLFTLLQGILQVLTAERVARDLRNKVAHKISKQSYSYVVKSNPSKFLTNLTSDMDSVKMFVSQAFVGIISSLFVIIGAAVLLLTINWKLALAVLGIVPVISTAFFIVFQKVRVLFKKSREVIDALNRIINESILGAALIRVLNSQQAEKPEVPGKKCGIQGTGLIDCQALFDPCAHHHVCIKPGSGDHPCPWRSLCGDWNTHTG